MGEKEGGARAGLKLGVEIAVDSLCEVLLVRVTKMTVFGFFLGSCPVRAAEARGRDRCA